LFNAFIAKLVVGGFTKRGLPVTNQYQFAH
jgi:hypothetical protein